MEPLVFTEVAEPAGTVSPLDGGQVAVFSARCPEKSSPNEDAAAVVPVNEHAAVLIVADGLGGLPAGQHASALAVREVVAAVRGADADEPNLRAAVLNGIENANRAICELGVGAASTLAVAEVFDRTVRPYHVGDSMILVVGQRGKVKLQTVSHSPVGYAVESGLLDEVEAMHHEDRHVVSNILGTPDMRIEIGSAVRLAQFDTVLLATDGLLDNLHTEEIIDRARKGPLKRVLRVLADDARRRMTTPQPGEPSKPDDLTFVLYRPRRGK
jgi:serine/threonine protein phosphatase PrpC